MIAVGFRDSFLVDGTVNYEIQVGDWPAGVYVLQVQSGERKWVRKFVVE